MANYTWLQDLTNSIHSHWPPHINRKEKGADILIDDIHLAYSAFILAITWNTSNLKGEKHFFLITLQLGIQIDSETFRFLLNIIGNDSIRLSIS